jgi:hypothetical protein
MLQTNPNDRWNIEQVDSEIKRINDSKTKRITDTENKIIVLKSKDLFEGK